MFRENDLELLMEYGLFLAKTITLVVAIATVVVIVFATSRKASHDDQEIEVTMINERYQDLQHTLEQAVLSKEALKAITKEEKKSEKLEKKEKKKHPESDDDQKRVFVASFKGDIKASDTEGLREIISMLLCVARPSDEVVIKLESQGGMVHSYGYAASQLARVKEAGIPLTVCIDMVAASGGYMMACVADRILAAPFAILGSIGVVAQIPNFHKLLKKNDIDYETLTAGEYKRTMTMFGENTEKGRKKFVEDLEDTHTLFKEFVAENRPTLDLATVATGEVWYGKRALEHHLIDEIKTSDTYVFELCKEFDVYEVTYEQKKTVLQKLGVNLQHTIEQAIDRALHSAGNRVGL